jgi:hypothetical protein
LEAVREFGVLRRPQPFQEHLLVVSPQKMPAFFFMLKQVIHDALAVRAPVDIVPQENNLVAVLQGQLPHQIL